MNHIDEHTLELYVLESSKIAAQRQEIEDHLHLCVGCRELVAQMSAVYRDLENSLRQEPESQEIHERALVSVQRRVTRRREPDLTAVSLRPTSRLQQFRYYARRHPMVTGGGTFAVLAGIGMLINTSLTVLRQEGNSSHVSPDTSEHRVGFSNLDQGRLDSAKEGIGADALNPSQAFWNTTQNRIEIRNHTDQALWSFASPDLHHVNEVARKYNNSLIEIADIDRDGTNEVVTALHLDKEQGWRSMLRVFDANKNLVFEKHFAMEYAGGEHPKTQISSLTTVPSASGQSDIIVQLTFGSTPCAIVRLDARGRELGRYWHSGNLTSMRTTDLDADGNAELLLVGAYDPGDTIRREYPVVVVLDPKKITGEKRSLATPEFTLANSNAELYYVQLPQSDIDEVVMNRQVGQCIVRVDNDGVIVRTQSHRTGNIDQPSFEYTFTRDLRVVDVKTDDNTLQLHDALVRDGKLKSSMNSAYFSNLNSGVRYWDGKEWRKDAARVGSEKYQ
ncbi:MAG: hypothetical protein HY961_03290 [Ignavibacteriae bacterium]|nr:hypothetical protein [Ignavibacteriota bacterium]